MAWSRRDFLKTGAVQSALAAGSVGAWLAVPTCRAGDLPGRIKKAVKLHMVQEDLPLVEKFRLLKQLGFDGVEVRRRDQVDPDSLVDAVRQTGLPIHGITNSSDPDLRGAIDLARQLGADSVLYVAGRVTSTKRYDDNYRETQAILRAAAPYAEQHQIKLLVENVWNEFLLSPLEMARYLDEIDSPWVGAYFDIGNVVRFGYPEQWIRILGARIGKLDVKEYSRKKQRDEGLYKGFEVEIGDGDIDWAAVREALVEIGYRGWATAEVRGGDRTRLGDIAARMDKVLGLT